jgi:tRNA(adenine34) deaminase
VSAAVDEQPAADEAFMDAALAEAQKAAAVGDVPVGAVVVHEGQIVGRGHNRREADRDPLAHAEIRALAEAAKALDRWRLSGCAIYVTLEPCFMCAGALVNARVDRLVFGADDPKAGAVASLAQVCTDERLNHRLEVTRGVRAQACSALLKDFFRALRAGRSEAG